MYVTCVLFCCQELLYLTLLAPTWAAFPGYFGYPVATQSFFPSVIPQQYEAQPLFAYTVYTAPETVAPAAPAPLAKSIYTSPDDSFRGYSYQTDYEGGGKSEVVFVTGPQANQLLQKSIKLFQTIVVPQAEQPTGRSLNSNATSNSTTASSTNPSTSNEPITSYYHVPLYSAHTSPLIEYAPPLQNLISSFAYSITNEIANSVKDASENAEEAQESMVHGDVIISPPSDTSAEETQNTTSAPQTTCQSPSEETSALTTTTATTTATATTTSTTTTPAATTISNPDTSTSSETEAEEINEVSRLNTTTPASEEITETTSA
jgi:hypothetical protein